MRRMDSSVNGSRRSTKDCYQSLAVSRLIYLGLLVLRFEAFVSHADTLCLTRLGSFFCVTGTLLGLSAHIASIALLVRESKQRTATSQSSQVQKCTSVHACGLHVPSGGRQARSATSRLQPLVVPLSMAGLVLELLSGVPPAALPYGRILTMLLITSIVLQRDPFWEVLPQLGAALALDFVGFLAAVLTGRYDTPHAVLWHLLSSIAAAVAVVALAPLYAGLPPPPAVPHAQVAATTRLLAVQQPQAPQQQQQQGPQQQQQGPQEPLPP
ncbi:hypothetical protein Agub_g1055, partial [Astrephomene gubernaculifera]